MNLHNIAVNENINKQMNRVFEATNPSLIYSGNSLILIYTLGGAFILPHRAITRHIYNEIRKTL